MIGLTHSEQKVFRCLTGTSKSVAEIVREVRLPRMTVYTCLLRLQNKKLATTTIVDGKKRVRWTRASLSSVSKVVNSLRKNLLDTSNTANQMSDAVLLHGKKEVSSVLVRLTKQNRGGRMYSLQHSKNWSTWMKIFGKKLTNYHNRLVVDEKLVCFTIHSPTFPQDVVEDQETLKAYKGRLGNSHVIPEAYLKKDMALYIFGDEILFVNLATVEASLYVNKELADFLEKMTMYIFEHGGEDEFFRKHNF